LVESDALEDRVGAISTGQHLDARDRLGAALADDIGGAKFLCERDAVGVASHDDDLLRAEPLRGDHAAQPHGTVADDCNALARRHLRGKGGVVAGAHYVRQSQ
jgi:hypothetical protein